MLRHPKTLGKSLSASHFVKATYNDKTHAFRLASTFTPNKIEIHALAAMGQEIFSMIYDGEQATVKTIIKLKKMKPEYLLFDLQLIYWPKAQIQQSLSGTSLTIKDTLNKRTIFSDNKAIIEISYDDKKITFKNNLRNYRYILNEH